MATDRRPRKSAASRPKSANHTAARRSSHPKKAPKAPRKAPARVPDDVMAAVAAALDKKAEHMLLLDLRGGPAFTDFFIICSGNNSRQVQAIADGIQEMLRKFNLRPALVEGYERAEWILLDYFDFIVHVFTPATREFYSLERLWGDARRIEIPAT